MVIIRYLQAHLPETCKRLKQKYIICTVYLILKLKDFFLTGKCITVTATKKKLMINPTEIPSISKSLLKVAYEEKYHITRLG